LANQIGQHELPKFDARFDQYQYRVVPPGAIIRDSALYANVGFPGLSIRYTTDGSDPAITSPLYTAPVNVQGTVKVRSFTPSGRGSRVFAVSPVGH
jgi:hexosaminidase